MRVILPSSICMPPISYYHFPCLFLDDSDAAVIQEVKNKHSSSHVRPHSVPGKDPSTSSQQNHPAKPSAGGATRETHQGKEVEKAPLIFAETNRNRVGWLMPDESIPEWPLFIIVINHHQHSSFPVTLFFMAVINLGEFIVFITIIILAKRIIIT